ncbi:MAG: CHRD domain-containing protein [Alphaproteobacteria bacterium]
MRRFTGGLVLAIPVLIGSADFAAAQHTGMKMGTNTLFLAQLDAKQVVGGSASTATGTGAFLVDRAQRTLAYNLTYEGLASGGAKSIAIHNFGQGKNGEVVKTICGADAKACPNGPSATVAGRLEEREGRPLDNNLLGEFASERTYVEIVGNDGKAEIRGQLSPNSAMVKVTNYTVNLAPAEGTGSAGTGTAVVSETHLPDGKIAVFYAATVAGTAGTPTNAALVSGPTPKERTFAARSALPKLQLRASQGAKSGGSLSGSYEVNRAAPTALFAARLITENKGESGMVVTTSRFPNGELYGALVPVP